MKLLVAYDGSRCSEAALDDLLRAGLPKTGEALILSVAEVWLSSPNGNGNSSGIELDAHFEQIIKHRLNKGNKSTCEAETISEHAKKRLQKILPDWRIKTLATYGSPACEILTKAGEFKADLIVVGSNGRTAVENFFLGSISNKVLTESHYPVRVARRPAEDRPTPLRIVIGFDGSKGAQSAVEAVAERDWHEFSEVRLISVVNPISRAAVKLFNSPIMTRLKEEIITDPDWTANLAERSIETLREKKLTVTLTTHTGNPKQILIEESEKWRADSIFVGANAFGSRVERFILGSVSAAVAARAHCSVEVVRKNE